MPAGQSSKYNYSENWYISILQSPMQTVGFQFYMDVIIVPVA